MTSQEMMRAKAKPGYWFINVAKIDQEPDWQERIKTPEPSNTLFGYDVAEFMAKQYR